MLRTGKAVALALALWYGLWLATGDSLAPVRAGVHLAPFLMIGAGCLAVALFLGRATGAAALAAIVAAGLAPAQPWLWRGAESRASGLRLTTLSNRSTNRDLATTARLMMAHPADIFVLQEITDPPRLLQLLAKQKDGSPPAACHAGTYVIIAHFPVGPPRRLPGNVALACEVALPRGPVVVYSVHLPRAIGATKAQSRALATLLVDAGEQTQPTILAGDFNASPLGSTMERARTHHANAFDRAGRGTGATFPTPARRGGWLGPVVRIDHVLLPPELAVLSARRESWHPPAADHFPVTAIFRDDRSGGPSLPPGQRLAERAR